MRSMNADVASRGVEAALVAMSQGFVATTLTLPDRTGPPRRDGGPSTAELHPPADQERWADLPVRVRDLAPSVTTYVADLHRKRIHRVLTVTFSVRPEQGEPSGFDLGDMTFVGDLGESSSAGHSPDQGMMIHLSVPLLLDSLTHMLDGRRTAVGFTGVDTSFSITFRRNTAGISVFAGARESRGELARAVLRATEHYERSALSVVPTHEVARADYTAAVNKFRTAIPGRTQSPDRTRGAYYSLRPSLRVPPPEPSRAIWHIFRMWRVAFLPHALKPSSDSPEVIRRDFREYARRLEETLPRC